MYSYSQFVYASPINPKLSLLHFCRLLTSDDSEHGDCHRLGCSESPQSWTYFHLWSFKNVCEELSQDVKSYPFHSLLLPGQLGTEGIGEAFVRIPFAPFQVKASTDQLTDTSGLGTQCLRWRASEACKSQDQR